MTLWKHISLAAALSVAAISCFASTVTPFGATNGSGQATSTPTSLISHVTTSSSTNTTAAVATTAATVQTTAASTGLIPSRMFLFAVTSDYYNPQSWQDPFTQLNWKFLTSNQPVDSTSSATPMKSNWIVFAIMINDTTYPVYTYTPTYNGVPLVHYKAPPTLTQNPAIVGLNGYNQADQWIDLWYCTNCTGGGSFQFYHADFGGTGSTKYSSQQVYIY